MNSAPRILLFGEAPPPYGGIQAHCTRLLAWLRTMPQPPDQVYVVHGEPGPADTLRSRIKHELGWRAIVPEHGSTWPT